MIFRTLLGLVAMTTAFVSTTADAAPIRTLPGLQSISFFERTGSINEWAYAPNHFSILNRRLLPLGNSNYDFRGTSDEYYDVYFSNADGSGNVSGAYVTINAQFESAIGGGLNISEVVLNFAGGVTEHANLVIRILSGGNNALPHTAVNAVDGVFSTHTSLGSTTGILDVLSLTVGFASTAVEEGVPAPGALLIFGFGLVGFAGLRRRV